MSKWCNCEYCFPSRRSSPREADAIQGHFDLHHGQKGVQRPVESICHLALVSSTSQTLLKVGHFPARAVPHACSLSNISLNAVKLTTLPLLLGNRSYYAAAFPKSSGFRRFYDQELNIMIVRHYSIESPTSMCAHEELLLVAVHHLFRGNKMTLLVARSPWIVKRARLLPPEISDINQ